MPPTEYKGLKPGHTMPKTKCSFAKERRRPCKQERHRIARINQSKVSAMIWVVYQLRETSAK